MEWMALRGAHMELFLMFQTTVPLVDCKSAQPELLTCQIPQVALLAQPNKSKKPSAQGHGAHVPGAGLLLPGLG